MICLDTCGTAGDGVCQDGGWEAYGSMCEYGTDCRDCGSRLLLDPPPSPPGVPSGPSAKVTVNTIPEHCTVQDCERNLAEGQAKYQQAVAAGQQAKDGWDGLCRLSGQLHAGASPTDSSLLTADSFSDCNCGIDTASFGTVSDCPDFLASMERACETLRACADSDSGARDAGPGLAIGLALGGCLLVAVLAAAVFVWHHKRRTQLPTSSASNAAPQQVDVIVTQPESKKSAAPDSLAALLAACGLEHHEKTFKAEEYTLDTLLSSMARGEEALKDDLRELKLTLGECRKLINHLGASK
jgi:hypothetical protein